MGKNINFKNHYQMSKDNTEILQRIKRTFKEEANRPNNLRLPGGIEFTIVGNDVKMHISSTAVVKNMQEDATAFEGWAMVLKRWAKFQKVILSWDTPDHVKDGHYQRFLFRVLNFAKDYKLWFYIEPSCILYQNALEIVDSTVYYLSSPYNNRDRNDLHGLESILEYKFSKGKWAEDLKLKTNADYLNRQLPVGVFHKPVSSRTSIFPRHKSAIDIWGITRNNELLLFELKADRNNKVGIISELYFYSCLMRYVQTGKFKHEKSDQYLDRIADTRKIFAYFLAPSLHLLVDQQLVAELNSGINPGIEIKYLQFDERSDKIKIRIVF